MRNISRQYVEGRGGGAQSFKSPPPMEGGRKVGRVRRYLQEGDSTLRIIGACALVLVNVVRLQELHLVLIMLSIGKIVTVLALILLFSIPAQKNVKPMMSFPQTKIYLALFALAVLSVPGGVWPGQSFGTVVNVLPKMALFYCCIIRFIHSEKDYLAVVRSFVLGMTFVGVLSIFSGGGRFSAGYTYDPNDLGMLLCVAFPLAYFMRTTVTGLVNRLVWLGCSGMLLVGIMATASRGAFLGICFIVPYCLFRDKAVGKVGAVLLLAVVAGLFALLAPDSYVDRISTLLAPEQDYNFTHQAGRIEVWKNGISIALEHPLLGVGINGFVAAEGMEHQLGAWKAAHNFLIQITAELGLGGLVLLLSLLYVCIRDVRRIQGHAVLISERLRGLTFGLEGSCYAFIITAFFLSQAYSSILLFISACIVALLRLVTCREFGEKARVC